MLAIRGRSGQWIWYAVPPEVKTYIMQLECYIRNPKESKLLERYPDRFRKEDGDEVAAKKTVQA